MAEQGGVLGPYLEAVKRYRGDEASQAETGSEAPQVEANEPEAPVEAAPQVDDARLKILGILAERQELGVGELQEASGLSFTDFGAALTALERAGLVEVAGSPGHEVARLTEQGKALTSFQAS